MRFFTWLFTGLGVLLAIAISLLLNWSGPFPR